MKDKLEFKYEKCDYSYFETWKLIYNLAKKIPCSDEEKKIYRVDYKYKNSYDRYVIISKYVVGDSRKIIYVVKYCLDSFFVVEDLIYLSNLENAKRVAMFIARSHLAGHKLLLTELQSFRFINEKVKDFDSYMTEKEKQLEEYETLLKKP